jgi:hypothetical protein
LFAMTDAIPRTTLTRLFLAALIDGLYGGGSD